jgi:hypothetical protein
MDSTTDLRGALRDLLQFHFGSRAWPVVLFWAVAALALGVFIRQILTLNLRSAVGYVTPEFRFGLDRAVGCWLVSTLFTYGAGFVMGGSMSREPDRGRLRGTWQTPSRGEDD